MKRQSQPGRDGAGKNGARIRTLLADDSPVALEMLGSFLQTRGHFELVGVAHNGAQALNLTNRLGPDLVLMDLRMPEVNGLQATSALKAQPNAPRVIIVTIDDTPSLRAAARTAGADGFVGKSDLFEQLPRLIESLFGKEEA